MIRIRIRCIRMHSYIGIMIVYVAMSGGVDSSVAAALLQERGLNVRGVFMRYWGDVDDIVPGGEDFTNCCNIDAMHDAERVCDHLGIPLSVMDLRGKFREDVVKFFLKGYESGITPNPCVQCNRSIKFELIEKILSEASEEERGRIMFATGHYIRTSSPVIASPDFGRGVAIHDDVLDRVAVARDDGSFIRMFVARDSNKDQSYFLYTLTQEKLQRLLFPIGEFTKPEIRSMAMTMGLPVALKKESQEVCFIKHNVQDFLSARLKNARPGAIVTTDGKTIGEHRGLPFYTIGQRGGLHLGGGGPYYVAEKQLETNTLVVARGDDDPRLSQTTVLLRDVNWISGVAPTEPLRVIAKPRYRHPGAMAIIQKKENKKQRTTEFDNIIVEFDQPERALTPGQSVVFYKDSEHGMEVLGGGIIEDS